MPWHPNLSMLPGVFLKNMTNQQFETSRKRLPPKQKLACFIFLLVSFIFPGCGGGEGGGSSAPPAPVPTTPSFTLASPAPNSSVSDLDFRAETFVIRFNYSNASAMNPGTLSVTMKMDNGSEQNITSYFSQTSATTIQSSNIYQFTRTLFDLPSNAVTRTMTLSASIKSQAGITGTSTASFTVYPVTPAPPPETPSS